MLDTILLILVLVGTVLLIVFVLRGKNSNISEILNPLFDKSQKKTEEFVRNEFFNNKREQDSSGKMLREEVTSQFEKLSSGLNASAGRNEERMDKVRGVVEQKLESLQKDNAEKLEKMRLTVDEKLHATLEKRFNESFKVISDRLEMVHKGLGEVQTLSQSVDGLKAVFNNVKSRGVWGEAQLADLIGDLLTPDQYERNIKTKKSSNDLVEFAIKLPGNDDSKCVWLPIDAKFPKEDYERLEKARKSGDVEQSKISIKALENRIKSEAKDIREKYINPPDTTDFAILFVPAESVYAEILQIPNLFSQISHDYRVIITGPSTMQAVLNSLRMGFRTLAIQKKSSEVWVLLNGIKNDFGKFGDLLEKTHKKIQEAGDTLEDAMKKTRTIERKLSKAEGIELPVGAGIEPITIEGPENE